MATVIYPPISPQKTSHGHMEKLSEYEGVRFMMKKERGSEGTRYESYVDKRTLTPVRLAVSLPRYVSKWDEEPCKTIVTHPTSLG